MVTILEQVFANYLLGYSVPYGRYHDEVVPGSKENLMNHVRNNA